MMAETVIVLYLGHFWTKFDESYIEFKQKFLRHNIPIIKEPIEIGNCAGQRVQPFHTNFLRVKKSFHEVSNFSG